MTEQNDNEKEPAEQRSNLIRRSEMILETSMDGFWVVNLDGKILEVNSSLCDILGYSRGELLKMTIVDIEAIETPEEIAQHVDKVMRQGYDRFETKHRRKDGKIIDVEASVQYCNSEGNEFLFCFFRDVTERKRSEVQLQMERNKLDSVIGAMEDSLTIRNLEYEITYQNKVIDDIYGDLRGKKCYQVFGGNDQICDGCPVKLAFRDGTSHTSVRELTMPSGGTVFWENTANPIRDASGKIIACLEMSKNITERRRIEKDLMESRRSLAMAQRVAHVGSWEWDILNDKLTWSDETFRQMGLKPNELQPTFEILEKFIHPDDREKVNEAVRAALEENKRYSLDVRMIRGDGTEWIMHTQGLTERKDDGTPVRFIGTQQDITERKRIEMEREMYRDDLLKAQRRAYIGSMGSIVAHQLNQPLTKLNILLDRAIGQIEEASSSPSVLKDVKEGLAQAHEAASIIRKFRQYSKHSAMESTGRVNVCAVVGRIVSVLSKRAIQADVHMSLKAPEDLPKVQINETALEQMLLVIVQNAIEAADGQKPHKLDISARRADGNIELEFSDDCCGIAPGNLNRIFEPFYSTKPEDRGMGLGLDIVKQILMSCGGHIRVESEPGKGATFYVTLPISNALRS